LEVREKFERGGGKGRKNAKAVSLPGVEGDRMRKYLDKTKKGAII